MATNELLTFALSSGANKLTYSMYNTNAPHQNGYGSGIARSQHMNYTFAEGALAAYVLGQFVCDYASQNATLNTKLYTDFKTALNGYLTPVKYVSQSLTTAQKTQARTNIDASSSAIWGIADGVQAFLDSKGVG